MSLGASDIELLLRDLGLDDAEVAERWAFLGFGAEDVELLMELHGLLERSGARASFVDAFYDHLQAFAATRALLGDRATLERLKRTQSEYFASLTAGTYGPDYVRHRVRVGLAHERVGLAPKWYLGAYNKYLGLLVPRIGALLPHDPAKAQRMALALLKIVLFDMGLAMDTYIHASASTLRRKNEQLEALNRLAVTLTSAQEPTVILDQVMVQGADLIGAMGACIAFYDADAQRFKDWVTHGLSPEFVRHMEFRPGGLADEAFGYGTHILSNDRPETRHPLSRLTRAEGIRGFVCLPLTSRAGRLGVIYFYRADRDSFEAAEIELLTTFAHLAAAAIENARLYARLENEARTDTLTGLCNRRVFDRRLEEEQRRARRYGKPYALMLVDIDHFKRVNDDFGHPAGDAVLAALGHLLALQVRDVDTVARYGGEEFAVIFPEIGGSVAKEIGERMRRAIAGTPFGLPDGRHIGVTVSIGVSCFPNCAVDAQAALGTADQALYVAKQAGRNRVLLFRETLQARLEKDPNLIVALLSESLDQAQPIATAVSGLAPFLRHHAERVMQATERLAQALALPRAQRATLRLAALLHDVGMLTVPGAVLNKRTPLTAEEHKLIQRHPVTGAEWLARVPALDQVVPLVRHHHERYDGTGYPDGLRAEAIPELARWLALADAYAAMLGDWPGRRARSAEEAKAELRAGAGSQFDPRLVERFVRALGEDARP
jgi:diguanylate cyclase (GGDEF)-like protein